MRKQGSENIRGMGIEDSDTIGDAKKMVKTYLTDEEHRQLRIAAAEADMTIGDFLKDAVLKAIKISVNAYLDREIDKRRSLQE